MIMQISRQKVIFIEQNSDQGSLSNWRLRYETDFYKKKSIHRASNESLRAIVYLHMFLYICTCLTTSYDGMFWFISILPAYQELIDQNTQRPEISSKVMALILNNLWSHVLWSSTERICLLSSLELLSKTKIHLERERDVYSIEWSKTHINQQLSSAHIILS